MNFENFEEYLSSNLKINDDKLFQEKLDLLDLLQIYIIKFI